MLGGCGFVGSHIVDHLLICGYAVRILDKHPEHFRERLSEVEYIFGDFRDGETVLRALLGVDAVVHLVSTTVPGTADFDPISDVKDNLIGTLTLLEAMSSAGVSRILFMSSGGTVYGVPEHTPIPEDHPLRPINSYGIVKASIEHYLSMYQRSRGLSPITIRASNPYGPRQGHSGVQGVISTFLNRIIAGEELEIWGDGSVVRDYLYISDLAELSVKALSTQETGSFNAGSGVGTSLREVVTMIEAATGIQAQLTYRSSRPMDVQCSILDVSRAQLTFGWHAQTEFMKGMSETILWMRSLSKS